MSKLKNISAKFDEKTITIYQGYNDKIADEALKTGTFGESFDLDRMSWIKTSFLWMMHRSGWGTKEGQERILSIEIFRDGFNEIISKAVLSKYRDKLGIYKTQNEWRHKLKISDVICQWDPDVDIYGTKIDRMAIQLGMRGNTLERYVKEYIYKINDISEDVFRWRKEIEKGNFETSLLPEEREYYISDDIKRNLGI
ncbi:DUF4291 domain-containing protein [Clostridium sp. YIM B02555]|uniref:DUF4291 domain-containing protein n=1 Tax=Clostridium sp. YIM B02555 TaxID=2911968 RepID=UPI001EED1888|nr:DUF4291 domain-containing protein [Clostridium sp. YIM B02555]